MRCRDALVASVVVASLAGCGMSQHGTATVWVTRDRGAHVLLVRTVPAGLTAVQGLERVARVKTRYAGRFVQAINGISGSLTRQEDWFYFVNGYEADRSAAEYRLHPGDVEWWDYRSWKEGMRVPIVVGAFPEPFLHGWSGRTRPTIVVAPPAFATTARAIARRVHGNVVTTGGDVFPGKGDNAIVLKEGAPSIRVEGGTRPGSPVTFIVRARSDPLGVLRTARFHYSLP